MSANDPKARFELGSSDTTLSTNGAMRLMFQEGRPGTAGSADLEWREVPGLTSRKGGLPTGS
jgi:hypothetical protein